MKMMCFPTKLSLLEPLCLQGSRSSSFQSRQSMPLRRGALRSMKQKNSTKVCDTICAFSEFYRLNSQIAVFWHKIWIQLRLPSPKQRKTPANKVVFAFVCERSSDLVISLHHRPWCAHRNQVHLLKAPSLRYCESVLR